MFGKRIDIKFLLEAYWVTGDVHRCMFTLEALMEQLPKDAIPIFVGDLGDRGKYSKNVMEFVLEKQYLVVEGNHKFLNLGAHCSISVEIEHRDLFFKD